MTSQHKAVFHPQFIDDLRYWVATNRRPTLKLLTLIEAILRDPYEGIGKPEPLKHNLSGAWSRRIDQEHRLIYMVRDTEIVFLQARFHYE